MNLELFRSLPLVLAALASPLAAQQQIPSKPLEIKASDIEKQIQEAEKTADIWMKHAAEGTIVKGIFAAWGYSAFDEQKPEEGVQILEKQLSLTGRLRMAWLMHDRCQVELDAALNNDPLTVGRFVVLRYVSEYEKRTVRERLTLYEPLHRPKGLKIVGLDRDDMPEGDLGAWDLGVALGDAVVLRWTTAPEARWKPYLIEAGAIAEQLKIPLPALPAAEGSPDEQRKALLEFLRGPARRAAEALPGRSGKLAAAALSAWRLLVQYENGTAEDQAASAEMVQRMVAAELPERLWQEAAAVARKPDATHELWDAVHLLGVKVSEFLSGQEPVPAPPPSDDAAKVIEAMKNVAKIGSYQVKAVLTSPDKRQANIDGILKKGSADITVRGFDGSTWRRVATDNNAWLSRAGGAWEREADTSATVQLTQTLTLPIDPESRLVKEYKLTAAGEEVIDGERLMKYQRADQSPGQPPLEFWIIRDPSLGPLIRRAHLVMSFADLQADTVLTWTKHGAPPEIKPSAK